MLGASLLTFFEIVEAVGLHALRLYRCRTQKVPSGCTAVALKRYPPAVPLPHAKGRFPGCTAVARKRSALRLYRCRTQKVPSGCTAVARKRYPPAVPLPHSKGTLRLYRCRTQKVGPPAVPLSHSKGTLRLYRCRTQKVDPLTVPLSHAKGRPSGCTAVARKRYPARWSGNGSGSGRMADTRGFSCR